VSPCRHDVTVTPSRAPRSSIARAQADALAGASRRAWLLAAAAAVPHNCSRRLAASSAWTCVARRLPIKRWFPGKAMRTAVRPRRSMPSPRDGSLPMLDGAARERRDPQVPTRPAARVCVATPGRPNATQGTFEYSD
jgi:hypothetical protein